MKKIKLLTPILGLTALSSAFAPLTSCSCGDGYEEEHLVTPDNGTADIQVITNKKGEDLVYRVTFVAGVELDWDNSSITINGELAHLGSEYEYNVDDGSLTIFKDKINGKVVVIIATKPKPSWDPYKFPEQIFNKDSEYTPDYLKAGVDRMEQAVWENKDEDFLWNAYRNSTDNLLKTICQDMVWYDLTFMKMAFLDGHDDARASIKAETNSFDWETKKFTGSIEYKIYKTTLDRAIRNGDPTHGFCQIQFENVEMTLNVTKDLSKDYPLVRLEPMMSYKYHNGENIKQTDEWTIKVKRTIFGGDQIDEYNINQNTDITQGKGKEDWDYIMTRILDKEGNYNFAPFTPYYFKSNLFH